MKARPSGEMDPIHVILRDKRSSLEESRSVLYATSWVEMVRDLMADCNKTKHPSVPARLRGVLIVGQGR